MSGAFALCLHDGDQVAVMAGAGEVGQPCDVHLPAGLKTIFLVNPVPFGHKVAMEAIAAGDRVFKYGQPIGIATADIPAGGHVHTHNLSGLRCEDAGEAA